jgi:hypothetical protein
MARKTIEIATAFKGKATITKEELYAYIHSIDNSASDDSIRQRISRHKSSGLIISVKKGVYAFSSKPVYMHTTDKFLLKLSHLFSVQYPEINFCVWSSAWLYDFTVHQPSHFFYVIETEADMVETAFNLLKDNTYTAFLNPDEQTIQLYVMGEKNPVIVKQLLTRAPLSKNKKIKLPSLEKMLVDAYSDKKMFYFIQGKELQNIFKFSFSKYSINLSSLLNYASRRGNEKEITDFILKNVPNANKILIND